MLALIRIFRLPLGWLLLGLVWFSAGCSHSSQPAPAYPVTQGEFSVWSVYEGLLDARRMETVMSELGGGATVIELKPEGSLVQAGEVLLRFDPTEIRNTNVKLEQALTAAIAELDGLKNATLPLELEDLESRLSETRYNYRTEQENLRDMRDLLKQDLISEAEVKQAELKAANLLVRQEQLERQLRLTKEHLHPSRLMRAQANVDASREQRMQAQAELSNCSVRAHSAGWLVYNPLHVGGEFRTVRVGDKVYQNQPLMYIPDMQEVVVHFYIAESDLGLVQTGQLLSIQPVAIPGITVTGVVEQVGAMAQARPGYPVWQKFFHIIGRVTQTLPETLRAGMSVTISVQSYHQAVALLVPRVAVSWENQRPRCWVRNPVTRRPELRRLVLGHCNEEFFEVQAGVHLGEMVIAPRE